MSDSSMKIDSSSSPLLWPDHGSLLSSEDSETGRSVCARGPAADPVPGTRWCRLGTASLAPPSEPPSSSDELWYLSCSARISALRSSESSSSLDSWIRPGKTGAGGGGGDAPGGRIGRRAARRAAASRPPPEPVLVGTDGWASRRTVRFRDGAAPTPAAGASGAADGEGTRAGASDGVDTGVGITAETGAGAAPTAWPAGADAGVAAGAASGAGVAARTLALAKAWTGTGAGVRTGLSAGVGVDVVT